MDRKSIIVLVLCFVFMLAWGPMLRRIYPPKPVPLSELQATNTATTVQGNAPLPNGVVTSNTTTSTSALPLPQAAATEGPESLIVITNKGTIVTFSSRGGGIKLIEFEQYPAVIDCLHRQPIPDRNFASINTQSRLSAFTLIDDGHLFNQQDFQLTTTPGGVHAEKQLPSGLTIVKDYKFSTNFLLQVDVSIQNKGDTAIAIPAQEWVVGTASAMNEKESEMSSGAFWYNGAKAQHVQESYFANRTMGCKTSNPLTEYEAGLHDVHWAAIHNQFFTMAVIPDQPAEKIEVRRYSSESRAGASRYQTALIFGATNLPPKQAIQHQFMVYAGPKEYNRLAKFGAGPQSNLDLIMDFGVFFGFFAKALLLSMNGLHAVGVGYGLAIILITVIIKMLFWPLTSASTRSMKRMQELQPQMKALQEKYKDDPRKLSEKQMAFWRENKVNPVSGCFPMLLQIPVLMAFYRMLQSAIELRGAKFLWACDLSQSDTVAYVAGFPINPLPLIIVGSSLWQSHLTPPSPGVDPMQQKMMKYMPLFFIILFYKLSAGLTLYWTVQNLLTIVQLKLTKTTKGGSTLPAVSTKK